MPIITQHELSLADIDKIAARICTKLVCRLDTGCWEWQPDSKIGYGQVRFHVEGAPAYTTVIMLTHRVMLLHASRQTSNPLCACHKCDNPRCNNYDHLFWGTQAENIADARAKNRMNTPYGESHFKCKMTEAEALEIIAHRKQGLGLSQTARAVGKSQGWIRGVYYGQNWKHLPR